MPIGVWVQVPSSAPKRMPPVSGQYARVVELADSLDSGSSVHYARAGSSPASRTKKKSRNRKVSGLFHNFLSKLFFLKKARIANIQQNIQQDFEGSNHRLSSVFMPAVRQAPVQYFFSPPRRYACRCPTSWTLFHGREIPAPV